MYAYIHTRYLDICIIYYIILDDIFWLCPCHGRLLISWPGSGLRWRRLPRSSSGTHGTHGGTAMETQISWKIMVISGDFQWYHGDLWWFIVTLWWFYGVYLIAFTRYGWYDWPESVWIHYKQIVSDSKPRWFRDKPLVISHSELERSTTLCMGQLTISIHIFNRHEKLPEGSICK